MLPLCPHRYMATLHPFSHIHHWLECHTHIMLLLTWVFGTAYACIPLANTATRSFCFNETVYYECSYDIGITPFKRRLFMASNIMFTFLLPLIVLIFTYSAIMQKLLAEQNQKAKAKVSTRANTLRANRASFGIGRTRRSGQQPSAEGDTVVQSDNVTTITTTAGADTSKPIEAVATFNSPIQLRKSTPYNHRSKVGGDDVIMAQCD